MRVQDPSPTLRLLKLKSLTPKPLNPCPVCGAETALAEIEPHPLHIKFEIHGYACGQCGPIKSLVALRSPSDSGHGLDG